MSILQTFKDFLTGGLKKEIKEKCGPFLKQSEGKPLYRGYSTRILSRDREVEVRKDRKPRDSSKLVHDLMNKYFEEKLGIKVRSEALFTIGDHARADAYGHLHYVFPVGNFKFVWGELDGQPITDTLMLANRIKDKMRVSKASEQENITREIMDKVNWRMDNLAEAIDSSAEIALIVDRVILIPVDKKVPYEDIVK